MMKYIRKNKTTGQEFVEEYKHSNEESLTSALRRWNRLSKQENSHWTYKEVM